MLMHWEHEMGHSRANQQQFLTCKRSRCEESFLACCSQPLVNVHATFLHGLKWGDNWFCSCVTVTVFDFTPHGPCSCLTVQQFKQRIAFSESCRVCPSLPIRSVLLKCISRLPPLPVLAACTWRGSLRLPQLASFWVKLSVCSKGQRGHAIDTVCWTVQL